MSKPAFIAVSIADVWAERRRWLGALDRTEREQLDAMTVPKRQRDWLAGRVAAKRAVQRRTGAPLWAIGIRAIADGAESGRPFAILGGKRFEHLSITHAGDVAVAVSAGQPAGIDVEVIEPRPELETLAFTETERADFDRLDGDNRDEAMTLMWCAKEAVAKHRGVGLRASFRELSVPPGMHVQQRTFEHGGCRMASAWLVC